MVLVNKDAYQRETSTEWPTRLPLKELYKSEEWIAASDASVLN